MKQYCHLERFLPTFLVFCSVGFLCAHAASECPPAFQICYEIRSAGAVGKGTLESDGSVTILENRLEVRKARVIANVKNCGPLVNGDFVLLDEDGRVFVNNKQRK